MGATANEKQRPNRPPYLATGGARLVSCSDLRKLHRLLLAVVLMEVVDLGLNLWRLRHG